MIIKLISYLPAIIGLVIVGIFVLVNNPKNIINRAYSLFTFNIAIWFSMLLLADLSSVENISIFALRSAILLGNFLPLTFLYFCYVFPVKSSRAKYLFIPMIFIEIIFIILAYTPFIIPSVVIGEFGAQPSPTTNLYLLTQAFVVIGYILGLVVLFIKYRHADSLQKNQIRLIFYATLIAFLVNIIFNLFFTLFHLENAAVFLSGFSIFLLAGIIGYGIVRHRLFDIRLVVARSVTYILTITIIATLYGFIAFRFAAVFLDNLSPTVQQTFYVLLTVVFAFTFAPLKRFFERVTTRIFYRDHYDSQELVNEIGRIMASEIDLDKVTNRVLQEVTKQIKINKGEIVVFGEKQLFYENNVFKDGEEEISPRELRKLGRIMLVADDLQVGERKQLLQKYGVSVSLALRTSEKFIGYMLLGEKKSGDIYNDEDLRVLKIIANEVSVGIANALSFKEIQQFNLTLQVRVDIATSKLRKVNDQLRELDAAKDEFISMASHQLRTPLTTVKGYASMLDEGDFGKLNKEQKDKVELTLDGATRMARLIDDLLNVSRMDANRFFLELTKVRLDKIVPEELAQLKSLAESKKVKLSYKPPTKPIPEIMLDEDKTRQVIMNLADNAVHYSQPPAGGGKVEISLSVEGECVVYKVQDNGIGVPKADQHQLFTKMFRASNAKDLRPDGTGLGLYLVKRVIEDQGGSIIFESTPGKGSTFGFKLPLSGVPKELQVKSQTGAKNFAKTHKE